MKKSRRGLKEVKRVFPPPSPEYYLLVSMGMFDPIAVKLQNAVLDKKLSYCCDNRSYCVQKYDRLKVLLRDTLSILTPSLVYIHCDRSVSTLDL